MAVENKFEHELDVCPYCTRPLEITAVKLSFSGPVVALFVCGCGWQSQKLAAQTNISNTRDGNGNLVRRSTPINNTQPMINSTTSNPARRVQNRSPTSDDVSRMLGHRK